MDMNNDITVIFGPTSSGKSELAIEIALKENGEIVNCDSMQLYKAMEIGVSAPTLEQRSLMRHHLYNIFPLHKKTTVYEHSQLCLHIVKRLMKNGIHPIIVGGSFLYVLAFIKKYFIDYSYRILLITTTLKLERVKKKVKLLPAMGFIDEVSALLKQGLLQSPSAKYAIGYIDCIKYLMGITSFSVFMSSIELKTIRLAKEQKKQTRSLYRQLSNENIIVVSEK
jgi:tRNA A37 N6-isopentenylltransferase MiaA